MRSIKVLHIVGASKFGGGAFVILRLAEVGKSLGFEVDILVKDPTAEEFFTKGGVNVVPLDVIWRKIRPLKDLLGLFRLYRFLRQNNYSIVHTHTSKAGFVGRIAARLARIDIIVHTVHGFAFHEESPRALISFYSFMEKFASFFCDRIITVSNFHRNWALKLNIGNNQKLVSIPNGIPLDRVEPSSSPNSIRHSLGVLPGELMILTTGRVAPQKGLEYLINAVPKLTQKLTCPVKLVIAGSGPLLPELQQMVNDLNISRYVKFIGFRNDIGDILTACDLVVLPSLREGLSIALLEAMAAEKPIITTTIGSNKEVTVDGKIALLVPPKDSDALVDAIIKMVSNKSLAIQLSTSAKKVFLTKYTEKNMMDRYRKIYLDLIDQNFEYLTQN